MNQYLSTYSIVSLYYLFQQNTYYLSADSIIKNHINLIPITQDHNFQNTLFYIEIEGNNMEFNVHIEYDQPISFRHKISKKYLNIIADEEEEKDTKYKLTLSNQKKYFKINPCFQYQTKISNKIKFNEQIYLSTSYTSLNSGSVIVERGEKNFDLFLSFTKGSKFIFHFYNFYEKEERYYKYGMIVWISHIESNNFLSVAQIKGKEEIIFQQIKYEKQIQNLSALWVLEPINVIQGKHLRYDEELIFKNLYSGQYLCFSKNYKLVDNERIYNVLMEDQKNDYSKFIFRSVIQKENKEIMLNSYLSLQHHESNLFIGCRKERIGEIYYKLLTFPYMDDQDLFKLNTFSNQQEQALRLIFSIRQEYKEIAKLNTLNSLHIGVNVVKEILQTYINIKQQLVSLKKLQKIFLFVTNELGSSIKLIVQNMKFLKSVNDMKDISTSSRKKKREVLIKMILKLGYDIISILCINNEINQKISFEFVRYYITDMSQFIGAEEIIIETFKNNTVLLPFVSQSANNQNLIRIILIQFMKKNKEKTMQYWQNLLKIINIFNTFIVYKNNPFDINQFVVSQQLFKNGYYELIFPPLHISGEKITVFDSSLNNFISVQNIKTAQLETVVYQIFNLFSNLVDNHSLNAKQYIHGYFSIYNQACITILIKYLKYNIKNELYNALINFISKCYIDSSPRIKRLKPYNFIFFIFQDQKSHIQQEEAYYSERLKEALILKAEESRVCKPLHYSNFIEIGKIHEPSMTKNQIISFRLNLTQKILNTNTISKEELQTIQLLLSLQCYTINELLQLYEQFKGKIFMKEIEQTLLPKVLQIFYLLFLNILELEIKKLKIYLQYKFMDDISEDEYKYMLPLSNRIYVPFVNQPSKNSNSSHVNADYLQMSQTSNDKQSYKNDYNELRDTLALMHASPQLKKSLINYFCQYSASQNKDLTNNSEYLVSIFNMIIETHLPKYSFLVLLSKATVLTHEEVTQFDHLFDLAKKLQYLVLISYSWILIENQTQNTKLFLDILKQFTNFMLEKGSFGPSKMKVDIKKQLIVGNLGIHKIILDLLQKNHYILLNTSKKNLKKKHKEIFELSFSFIYYFIKQCNENKKLLYNYYSILLLYLQCIELGQIKVYSQFYRDEKDYVKEINFNMIEKVIYLIIRQPNSQKNYENCVYNPNYLNLLIVIIQTLDVQSKFFIEKLYQFISKTDIFHKLLYLQYKSESGENDQSRFCTHMHKMRLEPLQIPIFYHVKLFKLIHIMLQNSSQLIKNALKIKLMQFLTLEYLFQLLAEPDIFSNVGIYPQANLILKNELLIFTTMILQKSELYQQIYESDTLSLLIKFYENIFLQKTDKKQINLESEQLVLQYLDQYNQSLNLYQNNQGQYYHLYIRPLIEKLITIFDKYLKRNIRNVNKDSLNILYQKLQHQFSNNLQYKGQSTGHSYGLNDVKLKWRNFVDEDEQNSKEEKYAKKMILDLLKSKKTKKYITEQLTQFYESIRENLSPFMKTMIKLIQILSSIKDIDDGRKKQINTLQKALKYFSGFINYTKKEDEIKTIIDKLQKNHFIELIIELTNRKQFQLSKIHLKNIFYYSLTIINFLLEKDQEMKFNKILYKRFQEITYANKFLQFLKDGAIEIISTIDSSHYYGQINESLEEMRLSIQNQPNRLYQASFRTLTFLCKYEPFTSYLRKQSSINSIDFLDKIYNIIGFLFNDQKKLAKNINVSTVRAAENIFDFIISMFTGGNQSNQNYIMDNKFGAFFYQILKIESLQQKEKNVIREDLLQKIVQFYRMNGIDIKDLLASKIGLIDFNGSYLLNRFKYVITRCLMQCLISNKNSIIKLKMDVPIQIIKLNLIWIFEFYLSKNYLYKEEYILKQRKDWKEVVELKDQEDQLFFRLGFYYYQIIILSKTEEDNEKIENQQKIVDQQKEKERIVRKFFATIKDYQENINTKSNLNTEQFSQDMKQYYDLYYKALEYFEKKTGSIEINLKENIIKIYFPMIPLTENITDEMVDTFQQQVVRISRNQKIKSLIEWENTFYEDIKGEDEYFKRIETKFPLFGRILRMIKYENEFLLVAWITCVGACLSFLIENYNKPTTNFVGQTFSHLSSDFTNSIHIFQLLFTIINLLVAVVISAYLCTRKIPLRRQLLKLKFQKIQDENNTSQFLYVWSNIFKETIYQMYIVIFLLLCIMHTFFAAFPLIEIIRRIRMGRFIIRSLKQTWAQLIGGIALLIVFNFVCIQIVYDFLTPASGYGGMCKTQLTCFILYFDQHLKDGNGVMGTNDSNYENLTFNFQILFESIYIVFGLRVFLQIFSGTIIDKFSELREEEQEIRTDQETICFICAQERFDLDLQYQGFEVHVHENHNVFNYMKYLFYLRRLQPKQYGIVEHYIHECKIKESQQWIPQLNSVQKQQKESKQKQQGQQQKSIKDKIAMFCQQKIRQLKKVHQKVQVIMKDVGSINGKN